MSIVLLFQHHERENGAKAERPRGARAKARKPVPAALLVLCNTMQTCKHVDFPVAGSTGITAVTPASSPASAHVACAPCARLCQAFSRMLML